MEKRVSVTEAKAKFSELVEIAIAGESIVITKQGRPVAKIVPFSGPKLVLGAYAKEMAQWKDIDIDGINWLEEFPEWKASIMGEEK